MGGHLLPGTEQMVPALEGRPASAGPEVAHPVAQMPPAEQNSDLQSAFSFLILIARFVILEDPAGLFGQAVRVKSRRARWLDRVWSRGWPVQ
jgi:hypothetical protein